MNDDKVRLRRYEDDLYVGGLGIMVMGIWSVMKAVMQIFLSSDDYSVPEIPDPTIRAVITAIVIAVIVVIMALILKVHFYIGLNAIRAAKGKNYKKGYFTAAVIMLVLLIISMNAYSDLLEDIENIDTTIASILVDITTIYIFIIVLISADKIKKLRSKAENGPEAHSPADAGKN